MSAFDPIADVGIANDKTVMSWIFKFLLCSMIIAALGAYASRPALGRTRPDLAALISFDHGPFGFEKTYTAGRVGPFTVGDTRLETVQRLQNHSLLEQDQAQLQTNSDVWRLSLRQRNGGWATYTIRFDGERAASVKVFYSLFAGL